MFDRTHRTGLAADIPEMGKAGSTVHLLMVIPGEHVLSVPGRMRAGSSHATFAFGMTSAAEAGVPFIYRRDRRRSLTRAASLETGHPARLSCESYDLGHDVEQPCSECGASMPVLPGKKFPPAGEDDSVVDMQRRRIRIPGIRYDLS